MIVPLFAIWIMILVHVQTDISIMEDIYANFAASIYINATNAIIIANVWNVQQVIT
jgi:hypothetical protein